MGFCPNCNQHLKNESQVNEHVKMHPEGIDRDKCYYKCKFNGCRYKTLVLGNLRKSHMNQHTGTRPYNCVDCGATFRSASSMTRHRKSLHISSSQGRGIHATRNESASVEESYIGRDCITPDDQADILLSAPWPPPPTDTRIDEPLSEGLDMTSDWQNEAFVGITDPAMESLFAHHTVLLENQNNTAFQGPGNHEATDSYAFPCDNTLDLTYSIGTPATCELSGALLLPSCLPRKEPPSRYYLGDQRIQGSNSAANAQPETYSRQYYSDRTTYSN